MGAAPVDPTLGVTSSGFSYVYANVASIKAHGYDIQLTTQNIIGKFNWNTNIIVSYNKNTVSEYLMPVPTKADDYIRAATAITPVVGMAMNNMYSYQWAGLDPQTGDPIGYYGKDKSTDYRKIIDNTSRDSLVYHGLIQPPYFGAIRNTINWKNLSLSFNISYKFGYYFRAASISYSGLFGSWTGHGDYSKRWMKPGDQVNTNVPSMVYIDNPLFNGRDFFYRDSEVLVHKGDHFRFNDVALEYFLDKTTIKRLPFEGVRLYANISGLNLVFWKSNNAGIDPEFNDNYYPGKTFSAGLNITL